MVQGFTTQPTTENLLSESAFSLAISHIPNTIFHLQTALLPGVTGTPIIVNTPLSPISVPGDDLTYNQLQINFMVDEELANWQEIYNWMKNLYTSQKTSDFTTIKADPKLGPNLGGGVSDATLTLRTNKQNPNIRIKFHELFPVQLGDLEFNAASDDAINLTCTAAFAYSTYNIVSI